MDATVKQSNESKPRSFPNLLVRVRIVSGSHNCVFRVLPGIQLFPTGAAASGWHGGKWCGFTCRAHLGPRLHISSRTKGPSGPPSEHCEGGPFGNTPS